MALLPSPVPRSRTKAKLAWLALARVLDGASPWARRIGHLAISGKGAREGAPVRYRARVEYDVTDFAGFQVQPGARTGQGELEAALATISGGNRVRVEAAGRTDAGVHATGQVIAFTDPNGRPAKELVRALDALLPEDVAIRDVRRVQAEFNPRYAARYREYRYTVWNGPRSPLRERFALGVRDPLDIAAMERRIVAVLLEVGHGKMSEEAVAEALASRRPAFNGVTAPAKGLCLRRVVLGPMRAKATPASTTARSNGER